VARDRSAPKLTVAARRVTRAGAIARGLRLTARCSEACRVTVVATVGGQTAKRLRLGRSRELGRASRQLGARATTTVAVRLSTRARSGMRRSGAIKARLTITAVDLTGNRSIAAKSVNVG
jgi:hypothetical protein